MTTLPRRLLPWAPFGLSLLALRSTKVDLIEAAWAQRANTLPDRLHAPLWTVMQSGALAAPVVAGGVAWAAGQRRLAGRLAFSGLTAYVVAKAVKRAVGRGRPLDLVSGITARGKPAGGNGFVSGHAAVSTALALELFDALDDPARTLSLIVPAVVGFARIYVGAHLPLDVAGGAALAWGLHRTARSFRAGRPTTTRR
ncbi:MAG: phosphatase PAP2 family protein [Actinomycetota bacterium]|nr:phosphatase PAP2 family protein [Actinomycetota bacterium]